MSLLDRFRPTPDYTSLDFDSVQARINDIVTGAYPQYKLNSNKLTAWRVFIGVQCFILDVCAKRINNAARQARITTTSLLAPLLGNFKLINYFPPGRGAATVRLKIVLDDIPTKDVRIEIGQIARTEGRNPVLFRAIELQTISAGTNPPEVYVQFKNSVLQQDVDASDGKVNQSFVLTHDQVIDGSVSVLADDGVYTKASRNNFYYSGRDDKHFTETPDDRERIKVTYGDGINGAVPVGRIVHSYETGGGAIGNVPSPLINVLESGIVDSAGTPVSASVVQEDDASGGADRPTLALMKRLGPITQAASDTTVKRTDFEARALNVAGVARALAVTSNEDLGVGENTTFMYLVPAGGGVASETLRNTVKAQIKQVAGYPEPPYPTLSTHQLSVFSANYRAVDWRVVAFLREGYKWATVKAAITAVMVAYFAESIVSDDPELDGAPNPLVDFGGNYKDADGVVDGRLSWSDMFNAVRDVPGVRRIEASNGFLANAEQEDVILLPSEFPVAGELLIIDGATGNSI